jgi:hypothetical protein
MTVRSIRRLLTLLVLLVVVGGAALWIHSLDSGSEPAFRKACGKGAGVVVDEAQCAGLSEKFLHVADDDYFADMDNGATKNPDNVAKDLAHYVPGISPQEAVRRVVIGRNNWIVWTAGNDRFWDVLATKSFGNVDLLKTISNAPNLKFNHDNRWSYLGLVNEPCFTRPKAPRKDRWGLWLDERDPNCPADPFEDTSKYPGVKIGARGVGKVEVGSSYGYATGVVGLRLFPNPDFDEKAQAKWDWFRYYNDPSYYNDKSLVRPYRVGMSCGFCHVGPNPTKPPAGDTQNPKWEWANLNSNPGAQYFWIDRVFGFDGDKSNFVYQLFHTSRPGSLDTSRVSSDYINKPRTMNAVYSLGARMKNALKFGHETIAGAEQNNKQFNSFDDLKGSPLNNFFDPRTQTVFSPRVLKDGSDSVGALGALNRVYINIGLFGDEWIEHFNPIVGGQTITPIQIEVGRKNSVYWQSNEAQTPDTALFFLATAKPDYLKAAPGGADYLKNADAAQRGRDVFAENCAGCHSSKLPEKAYSFFTSKCEPERYVTDCWTPYWNWTRTDEFKAEMKKIANHQTDGKDDFLIDNFLSTDLRVPISLTETNACSPLATNAIANNIWDNFSASSYKNLQSVGNITLHDPFTGKVRTKDYEMPAGGRGYVRPASLISLWSTAPYLQNNSVGHFEPESSVAARMRAFDDGIRQMLWPERRGDATDDVRVVHYETASGDMLPGKVDVTTETSYLRLGKGYLPAAGEFLLDVLSPGRFWSTDGIEIGPIPKGTPVPLISNINLDQKDGWFAELKHKYDLLTLLLQIASDLKKIDRNASTEQANAALANVLNPLIAVSKCSDYIVNRGHYFGTKYLRPQDGKRVAGLTDDQKNDLIEFLKTL